MSIKGRSDVLRGGRRGSKLVLVACVLSQADLTGVWRWVAQSCELLLLATASTGCSPLAADPSIIILT